VARASIPSIPNPSIGDAFNYEVASKGRPFLFTVTEPNSNIPLYDVALALHINPNSVEERMSKVKNVTMTYGGFVEYHWPDELDSISASASTGAFIAPKVGLTSARPGLSVSGYEPGRSSTIAYERFQDLLDLFHSNGMVYDSKGIPAIRGRVICIYDRGVFGGFFSTFEVAEEEENPFQFKLNWEFKVERLIYKFPVKVG